MQQRPVWQKMGIKSGERAYFANAPVDAVLAVDAPELDIVNELDGMFDYINCFVVTRSDLDRQLAILKPHLALSGKLWVSWPKARQLGSDLSIPSVIHIVYQHGLVESTNLRINDTWTSLKCTHPKSGKIYNNSYGTLPSH
jgi:hypothetical protein